VADGTVLVELRRGYQVRGKLLRPTMVTVASGGGQ
jgi:molecular chaperone GrpE (heat shock protein)